MIALLHFQPAFCSRKLAIALGVVFFLCGAAAPEALATSAIMKSRKRTANCVVMATDNCFKNGGYLCLPAKRDDQNPYTITISPVPATGWKVVGNPPQSIQVDCTNRRDLQTLSTIKFEKIKKKKDGTPDGVDEINVKVFVFWVDVNLRTSGTVTAQADYDKHDAVVGALGTSNLGIRPYAELRALLGGNIEMNGTVNPRVDGQTFSAYRYLDGGYVYRNGDIWEVIPGQNDADANTLDGTPNASRKIYDADGPGYSGAIPEWAVGDLIEVRINFDFWFTLNGLRCSDKAPWHLRRTARRTATGYADEGQNDIGPGSIQL